MRQQPVTPFVPADPWLRIEQVAVLAQVSTKTARRAIANGHLQAVRLGGGRQFRVRASWVDAWLEMFHAA